MGYRQGSYKPKGGLFHPRINVKVEELKGKRKETVRPDQPPRTQLIDALKESYVDVCF